MSDRRKFVLCLSLGLVGGTALAFLRSPVAIHIAYICAGIMLLGLGGFYSTLYLSKLIPSLEAWLVKKGILLKPTESRFGFLDGILLVLVLSLTLYGVFLITVNINGLF